MSRTNPPHAALAVVAATAAIFIYFSCSGSSPNESTTSEKVDSFGHDLEDTAKAFDPMEAGLTPGLATECSDITDNSRLCENRETSVKIGKD